MENSILPLELHKKIIGFIIDDFNNMEEEEEYDIYKDTLERLRARLINYLMTCKKLWNIRHNKMILKETFELGTIYYSFNVILLTKKDFELKDITVGFLGWNVPAINDMIEIYYNEFSSEQFRENIESFEIKEYAISWFRDKIMPL